MPTQRADLDLTDPASFERFFGERRAAAFLCEHVWEHLTPGQARAAASTCFRWLEPGGRLRVAVPDGLFPDGEYQKVVQVGGPGPADHPAADHQVVYTGKSLPPVFVEAGFRAELLEWWDKDGAFQVRPWRLEDGPVYRSSKLDHRNRAWREHNAPPGFTSVMLDAWKPDTERPEPYPPR